MTSHDVVAFIRKLFLRVKIGHGGTLDPGAAGVLPILLGRATRLAPYLQEFPKTYRAELYLGISTDTGDAFGRIIARSAVPSINLEAINDLFRAFTGELEQVAPMYSAVKSRGEKLYTYARRGVVVERPSRRVNIYELKMLDFSPPQKLAFSVKCSSGTYVRTLCEQIGAALGCSAHMSFLLRTGSGAFQLGAASTQEELAEPGRCEAMILPPDFPFREGGGMVLKEAECELVFSALQVPLSRLDVCSKFTGAVDGTLLAVYTTKGDFAGLVRLVATPRQGIMVKAEKRWQQ